MSKTENISKANSEEKVIAGQPVTNSPHEDAIYEAGKSILLESVAIGRDFCKFMITASTGAIPLYLGLLKFIYPNDSQANSSNCELFFMLLPCILFLITSAIFIFGLLPKYKKFSLDSYEDTELAREHIIDQRMCFIKCGVFIFGLAVLASSIIAIKLIIK